MTLFQSLILSILSVDCVEFFALLLKFKYCDWISCVWIVTLHYICFLATGFHVDWIYKALKLATGTLELATGCIELATGFPNDWLDQMMSYQLIQTTSFAMHPRLIEYNAVALDWMCCSCLLVSLESCTCCAPTDLYRSSFNLRIFSDSVPAGPFAPADLSSSAEYDVVTNDIIIDGPFRCSSWFNFDVPADPSSSSSACSWFISFQLIHFAPAGSTWPPPDFEHLT
ncbi:transporter arsB-like [Dorcoceras hygrometricum]|uniref:Transporter arsB-like n=1 Tax=Dorcoceras hygrometricum TaxID=472368 RepID=A0A2Z7BX08_9LAMI|nr:transporter arsB-like [Dorcoceras hygrometricum]